MKARSVVRLRYSTELPAVQAHLVANPGTRQEQRVPLAAVLEIGRDEEGRTLFPGLLLLPDSTVSRRHCIIARAADRRWYVRDLSRNGTRVGGRRLVPNVETEIRAGDTLTVGAQHFLFEVVEAAIDEPVEGEGERSTEASPTRTMATVLVGDIRDYTILVRRVPSTRLQRSVARVFEILDAAVTDLGGTIKEYPGDAVVAFWEGGPDGEQAVVACRAALHLDQLARVMAADPAVWEVADFPLLLDWALATGSVLIHTFGGEHPQGLSLVGAPVVLAFRLEKLAGEETGPILTCGRTRKLAGPGFVFRDLGATAPKGFERADHVYVLQGESSPATMPAVGLPQEIRPPG